MPPDGVVAIVNPFAGAGATRDAPQVRQRLLEERFAAAGVTGCVRFTERAGHAGELARAALDAGAALVIAWGGDGTINEIASAVSGSRTPLGIVPAGSGNGFANELGLDSVPRRAIDTALLGRDRVIDGGEFDGRRFFNIAGTGLDAAVAERFNTRPRGRRGLGPYLRITARELMRYKSLRYRIRLDGDEIVTTALFVVFANGREFGNRIRIAPGAKLDDGLLEAIVVEDRPPLARLWSSRFAALGRLERTPGMIVRGVRQASIETDREIVYQIDGETGRAPGRVEIRVVPATLTVRVAR
ncbi:MAG TPA: diacylglycerol kinase family protein [Vicinamibacterales bacterium]|jgi:YegS/Rv2252/BmrU family lipid kinase